MALDKSPSYEIIYNVSHTGRAFETNNKEVHRILDELTLDTDAVDWIKTYCRRHDGRVAWIEICEHYDGKGEKCVMVSRANIDQAFYNNESTFNLRDTQLVSNMNLISLGSTTNLIAIVKRSRFC